MTEISIIFEYFPKRWKDDFLTWDPKAYGDIERITVDPGDIWLPDFCLSNSYVALHFDCNNN